MDLEILLGKSIFWLTTSKKRIGPTMSYIEEKEDQTALEPERRN